MTELLMYAGAAFSVGWWGAVCWCCWLDIQERKVTLRSDK